MRYLFLLLLILPFSIHTEESEFKEGDEFQAKKYETIALFDLEGNIIKYISRHRNKNGAEDIIKIIHYAHLILELEYGEK